MTEQTRASDITTSITVEMVPASLLRDAATLLRALSEASLGDRSMVILALAVIQTTRMPVARLVSLLTSRQKDLRRVHNPKALYSMLRPDLGASFGEDAFIGIYVAVTGAVDDMLDEEALVPLRHSAPRRILDELAPQPRRTARSKPPGSIDAAPSRPRLGMAPMPKMESFGTADAYAPPPTPAASAPDPVESPPPTAPGPPAGSTAGPPPDDLAALRANAPARANADAAGPVAGKPAVSAPTEPLDVSAFAPAAILRAELALVQVFLHRPEQAEAAAALAREADAGAARRGITTLLLEVAEGQRVDIVLEAAGAVIDTPAQWLVWRGRPIACQFWLAVAADFSARSLAARVVVSVDRAPAGALRFVLPVADQAAASRPLEMKGDSARRYSHAFLSYASPDRAEVLKRAQALKALGVSFFQDLLSLEPGQKWEKRLYEEIDRCDLFLLFWSSHAAASKWVVAETERALARQKSKDEALPDIVPIVLEGPPLPKVPENLKAIHMNDWLRYVIAVEEAKPPQP